jgi:hypothetical protein
LHTKRSTCAEDNSHHNEGSAAYTWHCPRGRRQSNRTSFYFFQKSSEDVAWCEDVGQTHQVELAESRPESEPGEVTQRQQLEQYKPQSHV